MIRLTFAGKPLVLKKFIRNVFGTLGYEFRKKTPMRANQFNASYLSQLCQPRTVIDVGVGKGTPALYEAFPAARLILVEPLRDYQDYIDQITKKYSCEVHYKAVGSSAKTLEIQVDTANLERSSFAKRSSLTDTGDPLESRVVEVTTLDKIFQQTKAVERPIVLKIDAEGHELEALEGARELLAVTDFVIAEVSIAKRFEEGYEFEDLVLFMKDAGFALFSFVSIAHVEGELRPRFCDVVFERRTS